MDELTFRERELVALGAALGSNCIPCVEHHVGEAKKAGLTDSQISAAIQLADQIRKVPAAKALDAALHLLNERPVSPTLGSRYIGDPAEAEDLVQETFARIERGLPGFAGRSSMKTWAFSIATRVAADYLREPGRRVAIVEIDEASGEPTREESVEQRLIVDEMSACVRRVIENLPEDYRAALVLHELQGLTAEETAAICGTSLATAKIRIHRARVRLKAALEEECSFYRDAGNVFRCDRKES
jgi:RNA polymerase sigma-70 factor, ECF subfamily